jgi:ribokinase
MGKVVVVGSSNTDMIIQAPRIPAPGETVLGGTFSTSAGGKGANQAVAAARLGGDVSLVASLGSDMFGKQALQNFENEGIDTRHCLMREGTPSGVAQIIVAEDGQNSIAVAPGANANLNPDDIANAGAALAGAAVVLAQLEIPLETVLEVAHRARTGAARMILDPAPARELPDDIYPLLDLITPNESEVAQLTGVDVSDADSAAGAAAVLHGRGVNTVIITRGDRGVYLSEQDGRGGISATCLPAFTVPAIDTTAAGDVFNGCLAAGLAGHRPLAKAVRFAQAAAALSVQALGAQSSVPTLEMVVQFLHAGR